GLVAFLDAKLVPGAPLVVEAAGFDAHLEGADLVITGEGRVDEQTAYGKAPGEVARRAHAAGVPVLLLAGSKGDGWEALRALGVDSVVTLTQEGEDPREALNAPDRMLTRAAVVACRTHSWTRERHPRRAGSTATRPMSSSCALTGTATSAPSRSCTAGTSRRSSGSSGASSATRSWPRTSPRRRS